MGWEAFWTTVTDPRVVASYRLTFGASLVGALINALFGFIAAWTLVRYSFPGKRLIDALVDLPFVYPVERHSAAQHLEKLTGQGRVSEPEPGHYVRTA